jgi:hypothetical protein
MEIISKPRTIVLKAWGKLLPLGEVLPEFTPMPLFDALRDERLNKILMK